MSTKTALGVIDAQRGFMPDYESAKYWTDGFGELPVTNGEKILPALNELLMQTNFDVVFTTQDWHPADTAHFALEPNYDTTWPIHCVADTKGAELHPALETPDKTYNFKKGMENLEDGADDTSYSGYNSVIILPNGEQVLSLPELLEQKGITRLYIGGLALDYCVKATALDFASKTDIQVVVVQDTTKPVNPDAELSIYFELRDAGVTMQTSMQVAEELGAR